MDKTSNVFLLLQNLKRRNFSVLKYVEQLNHQTNHIFAIFTMSINVIQGYF